MHGGSYVLFSQSRSYSLALGFIALSRAAVAVSSVLNFSQLLRHVADEFRGRVFATGESLDLVHHDPVDDGAGVATQSVSPRTIGFAAGVLSSTTAIFWAWANSSGKLPEPEPNGVDPADIEVHGDPTV